jgi:alpha-galactosidase
VLGIGGNIADWSDSELDAARQLIAAYKEFRPLVQLGQQYWLVPPSDVGACAVQYVSPGGEETVVFTYQLRGLAGAGVRRIRLHGLQPERRYRRAGDGAESSGAVLMTAGLPASVAQPASPGLDWQSGFQVWRAV